MNKEKNKKRFIELLNKVNRFGIKDFINWLETTDFFTAPASTKYHNAFDGGLLDHSLNVYKNLLNEVKTIKNVKYSDDTLIIVALLHDICKADFYETSMRNVKKNDKWIQEPYYTINDSFPIGHGEKSVIILQQWFQLTSDEIMAIRWHMGAYESKDNYSYLSAAFTKCPLALLLNIADMKATYIDEVK